MDPRGGNALRLGTVCAPMFLVLLDVLVVNVAMPSVGHAFDVGEKAWSALVDAYTLPLAATLLGGGWLTDRLGARRLLITGLAVFAMASVVCASAPTWAVLLAGRAAQGLGAAAMLPASLAVLTALWTTEPERSRALGVWSGISALATALGPALGGLVLAFSSWRTIFWLNLPICVAALLGAVRLLAPVRRVREDTRAPVRRTALMGSTLAGGLMTVVGNGSLTGATLYLRESLALGPLPAALVLLVATIPFAALGPASGRLMHRRGRRCTAVVGIGTGAVALAVSAALADRGAIAVIVLLLGVGVALGLMTAPIVGEAMSSLPGRQGLAAGVNNTARQIGTSVGVAGATALIAHRAGGTGLALVAGVTAAIWCLCVLVVARTFSTPATG
jgi:DHA2 family methylenomycin A resistance protein-like MFS transporter